MRMGGMAAELADGMLPGDLLADGMLADGMLPGDLLADGMLADGSPFASSASKLEPLEPNDTDLSAPTASATPELISAPLLCSSSTTAHAAAA